MERLQKIIAESGICSRRKAEELIKEGKVSVNGMIVDTLGFKAEKTDDIEVNGYHISKEEKVVYLMNKPKNVISSAHDDRGRTTVVDLIQDCPYRLYPLGRLDYDSSGLILLSNDGELMQALTHPKYEVEKTYEVKINALISQEQISRLEKGVKIEDYVSAPAKILLLSQNENKKTSSLLVTIHEGKNREIRKMFETIGARVVRLNRIKEANLELGNLQPGQYRKLKPYELTRMKNYLNGSDFQ